MCRAQDLSFSSMESKYIAGHRWVVLSLKIKFLFFFFAVMYFAFDLCSFSLAKYIFCWKEKTRKSSEALRQEILSSLPSCPGICCGPPCEIQAWDLIWKKEKKWNFSTVCSFVSFMRAAVWALWCQLPETGNHHANCFGPSGCLARQRKVFSVIVL